MTSESKTDRNGKAEAKAAEAGGKAAKAENGRAERDPAKGAALKAAVTQIERQFGQGSLMRLGDDAAPCRSRSIPTGALSLDLALGVGGVPRGRIVEIFGPESSGKTTLVYEIIAQAQKTGGVCAFIDTEHAIDPAYAAGSAWTSTSCSSRSPTTASRRSRSRTC